MTSFTFLRRSPVVVLCGLVLMSLAACGAGPSGTTSSSGAAEYRNLPPVPGQIAPSWQPLVQRLQADRVPPQLLSSYFSGLPEYSPDVMVTKVKELYRRDFRVVSTTTTTTPPVERPPSIYRHVVTAANLERCKTFLGTYKAAFDNEEKKHGIPREIVVSLILMETNLGRNLGGQNAFWSLASMAAATSPDKVVSAVPANYKLDDKQAWLQNVLTDKSNWAYKELKALITHCSVQNLDPKTMPGSVYGAIGICQFMPSNLGPYGDDGDGDGVVNLFSEPDAIMSVGRYLSAHGWKPGMTVAQQRAVIMRYNKHLRYANTILAMGETINTGVVQIGPPDAPEGGPVKKMKGGKKGGKGSGKKGKARKK